MNDHPDRHPDGPPPPSEEERDTLPAPPEAGGWASLVDRLETNPLVPYVGATGVAAVAMTALVLATTLPAAGVLTVGLTFLAVAMALRGLDELPDAVGGPLGWITDRFEDLGDRFGLEFYGTASVTSFVLAEVRSLAGIDISVADLLANPLGSAISWLVSAFIESIMNVIWAALWPLRLAQAVVGPHGLVAFVAVLVAAWGVWRVLDMAVLEPGEEAADPDRLEGPDRP